MSSSNTAQLIIEGAIRLLKGSGYKPTPVNIGAGLTALNDLLSSWSADKILVYAIVTENFSLVVGQSEYSIGPGGDFSTVRPTKILNGAYIRDFGNNDHPIKVITREQYKDFNKKDNNGRPSVLYYEPFYPLGTVYFDLQPNAVETLYLDSLKPITEISSLSASLALPPEYRKALRYNLALELAVEFADIKIPQLVAKGAEESKDALERVNSDPLESVTFDNILMPERHFNSSTFNAGH